MLFRSISSRMGTGYGQAQARRRLLSLRMCDAQAARCPFLRLIAARNPEVRSWKRRSSREHRMDLPICWSLICCARMSCLLEWSFIKNRTSGFYGPLGGTLRVFRHHCHYPLLFLLVPYSHFLLLTLALYNFILSYICCLSVLSFPYLRIIYNQLRF